jgi:dihydroneopterin triphosphate diphosphatase
LARAPFQVLVLPYRRLKDGAIAYAVFRRRDDGMRQAIAGGGEDNELPLEAAKREAWEEAGIEPSRPYLELASRATIPVVHFAELRDRQDLFVIPEYCFAVEVAESELRISNEHVDYAWLPFSEAHAVLRWDSNKTALWELDRRLRLSHAR